MVIHMVGVSIDNESRSPRLLIVLNGHPRNILWRFLYHKSFARYEGDHCVRSCFHYLNEICVYSKFATIDTGKLYHGCYLI